MSRSTGSEKLVPLPLVGTTADITKNILKFLKTEVVADVMQKGGFLQSLSPIEVSEGYGKLITENKKDKVKGKKKKKKTTKIYTGKIIRIYLNGCTGMKIHIFVPEETLTLFGNEVHPVAISCYDAKREIHHYVDEELNSVEEVKELDSSFFGCYSFFNWDALEEGIKNEFIHYNDMRLEGISHEEFCRRLEIKEAEQKEKLEEDNKLWH